LILLLEFGSLRQQGVFNLRSGFLLGKKFGGLPMESTYKRIVVKLGTSTLTGGTAYLSPPMVVDLVRQMSSLHDLGRELILVTSGAIAVGRQQLDFPRLPKDIPAKQMLAAVGQPRLMALYEQLFGLYGITVAQVMLTRNDLSSRTGYLNSRNTLEALIASRLVPIVNENDTVATEEIRVGDNDNLSAMVATLIEANLLVLLTDQQGLFTGDPRKYPDAQLIPEITGPDIPEEIWRAAGKSANGLGTGGMLTKLQAADLARRSGAEVVIARGSEADVLLRISEGEQIGTHFKPAATALESRKRFILAGGQAIGSLQIDQGAYEAIKSGGSLLPVGVVKVEGDFGRGDTVGIIDSTGREIAKGFSNYAAADLIRIRGMRSDQIEQTLGYVYGEEAVHRNNLVLL
jgi:glutamate 5-kinase